MHRAAVDGSSCSLYRRARDYWLSRAVEDVRNILPYAAPPPARRLAVGAHVRVLAWCFGPTWLGWLLYYLFTAPFNPDMWDHEPFSWGWAIFYMVSLGTLFGLPLYALALLGILIAGRFGIGPAAKSRANPPTMKPSARQA